MSKHMILMGQPGSGVTLAARKLKDSMPAIERARPLQPQIEAIHTQAGLVERGRWNVQETLVPFRAPHHSVSLAGLMGTITSGWKVRPGEVSLSHGGILFLDSVQEFPAMHLHAIAEVALKKEVRISSMNGESVVTMPADFQLVIGATASPCGFPPKDKRCVCGERAVSDWMSKLKFFEVLGPKVFSISNGEFHAMADGGA